MLYAVTLLIAKSTRSPMADRIVVIAAGNTAANAKSQAAAKLERSGAVVIGSESSRRLDLWMKGDTAVPTMPVVNPLLDSEVVSEAYKR